MYIATRFSENTVLLEKNMMFAVNLWCCSLLSRHVISVVLFSIFMSSVLAVIPLLYKNLSNHGYRLLICVFKSVPCLCHCVLIL